MEFFLEQEGKPIGPFSKEELLKKISSDSLVWHKELSEWKKAIEIEALKEHFAHIPPPLPVKNLPLKVEATIKKEKNSTSNGKTEIQIAKEIKTTFYLTIIALCIAVVSFFIKQATTSFDKYDALLNGLNTYQTEESNILQNGFLDEKNEYGLSKRYSAWKDENRKREDSLYSLADFYGCLRKKPLTEHAMMYDSDETIRCLKYQTHTLNEEAYAFAKKAFFIILISLVVGRYVLKGVGWVNKKSK